MNDDILLKCYIFELQYNKWILFKINKFLLLLVTGSLNARQSPDTKGDSTIHWMSWQEAIEANQKAPRKIAIDLFTEWCVWCKEWMRQHLLTPPSLLMSISISMPLNLTQNKKDSIVFNDHTFHYIPNGRRVIMNWPTHSLTDNWVTPPWCTWHQNGEDHDFTRI